MTSEPDGAEKSDASGDGPKCRLSADRRLDVELVLEGSVLVQCPRRAGD